VTIKKTHRWIFLPRFKAGGFGWRSDLPIKRIREAVSEIKKVARRDKVLGAEGAVIFLERISQAIEHVDSSSGAIGTAVNRAVETLVPIITEAPANDKLRDEWLNRLWNAVDQDEMPYIEQLADDWGALCHTTERASRWADEFIESVRLVWKCDTHAGGYFKGTVACLSGLLAAGRYDELLQLLEIAPYKSWHYRQWGVKALHAQGHSAAAIRYAEGSRGLNESDSRISSVCEDILLSSGMRREAYDRYALEANRRGTYLATFRAIAKKYPEIEPGSILRDLVASTPGNEGKWFAAAKSVGLYGQAIAFANRSPCDPKTLTQAARDFADTQPDFARSAGLAALKWMMQGHGYELTAHDVADAFDHTLHAARRGGCEADTIHLIRGLMACSVVSQSSIITTLRQKINASQDQVTSAS
jgi:hypothetical protein